MPSKNRPELDPIPKRHAACDECRTRKLRCSGEYPSCARCVRDRVQCVYSPQKTMGRPRKRQRPDDEAEVKDEDGRNRFPSAEADSKRNSKYNETTLDLSDNNNNANNNNNNNSQTTAPALNYGFTSAGMGNLSWENLTFSGDVQADMSKMFNDPTFAALDASINTLSNNSPFCSSPYGGPAPNLFENFDFGALYSSDAVPCHDFSASSLGSSVQKAPTPMSTTPPAQLPPQPQQHQQQQPLPQLTASCYPFINKNTTTYSLPRKQPSPPTTTGYSPPPKTSPPTLPLKNFSSSVSLPLLPAQPQPTITTTGTIPTTKAEPLFTSPPATSTCGEGPMKCNGLMFPVGDGLSCECLTSFFNAVIMLKKILHNPLHLSPPTPTNDPPPPITLDMMLSASRTALNVARDALYCPECRMCFTTVMNLGQLLPCLLALYSRCKDASESVAGPTMINASLLQDNPDSSKNSSPSPIIPNSHSPHHPPTSPSIMSISRPGSPESLQLVDPATYRAVAERVIKGEVDRLLLLLGIMEVRSLARHGLTVTTEMTKDMVGRGIAEMTANGSWKGERQPLCLKIVTTVRGMVDGLQSGVPVGACKRVKVEAAVGGDGVAAA